MKGLMKNKKTTKMLRSRTRKRPVRLDGYLNEKSLLELNVRELTEGSIRLANELKLLKSKKGWVENDALIAENNKLLARVKTLRGHKCPPAKIKTVSVTEDLHVEDDVLADHLEPFMRHKKHSGLITVTVEINKKVVYSKNFYQADPPK